MKPDSPAVTERLRRHGLRPTRARRLILARLLDRDDHPGAEDIRSALARRGYPLSVATLYQNLKRLVEHGALACFAGDDGVTRYDANGEPHAHLVCVSCGRVADIGADEPLVRELAVGLPGTGRRLRGWMLSDARLELHGRCPRCRRRKPAGD